MSVILNKNKKLSGSVRNLYRSFLPVGNKTKQKEFARLNASMQRMLGDYIEKRGPSDDSILDILILCNDLGDMNVPNASKIVKYTQKMQKNLNRLGLNVASSVSDKESVKQQTSLVLKTMVSQARVILLC